MTTIASGRAVCAGAFYFLATLISFAQTPLKPSTTQTTQITPDNPIDPLGVWSRDEIQPVPPDEQLSKAVSPLSKPSIHVYTFDTPRGQVVVSQLWNDTCSTTLCPTRQVLIKPDGTRELQLEDMLPQVDPEASRAPGAPSEFSLAPDGTLVQPGETVEERALRPSGETAESLEAAGMPKVCAAFGAEVSSHEGRFTTRSTKNCLGAFQFCPGTFEQYYSGSSASFLADPKAQVAAWTKYEKAQWNLANRVKLTSLIDTSVCFDNKCTKIDASSILMACQFGCGPTGKLAHYMQRRDCTARDVQDGFGTSVCRYLVAGAGKDVSCFTGGTSGPISTGPGTPGPVVTGPVPTCPPAVAANPAATDLDIVDGAFSLKYHGNASTETLQNLLSFMKARSGAPAPQ